MRAHRRRRSSAPFLFPLLALAGCTFISTEYGRPVLTDDSEFEDGATHFRDVMSKLGPPTKLSAVPGGMAFQYEHLRVKERQFGISIPIRSLEWLKLSLGRARGDQDTLLLLFDHQGLLKSHRLEERELDLGAGTSVQIFFAVAPTVDTSGAEADYDTNKWGMALLRSPPEMLNSRQSLESGQNGMQRRGTPEKAGQHTLEMR